MPVCLSHGNLDFYIGSLKDEYTSVKDRRVIADILEYSIQEGYLENNYEVKQSIRSIRSSTTFLPPLNVVQKAEFIKLLEEIKSKTTDINDRYNRINEEIDEMVLKLRRCKINGLITPFNKASKWTVYVDNLKDFKEKLLQYENFRTTASDEVVFYTFVVDGTHYDIQVEINDDKQCYKDH